MLSKKHMFMNNKSLIGSFKMGKKIKMLMNKHKKSGTRSALKQ